MKAVRFRKEYTDVPDVRLSYELEVNDPVVGCDFVIGKIGMCYFTKLLGHVLVEKMESSKDTDTPALDIFIKLSNIK